MTDTELATLELCARGAMSESWYTKTTSADDTTAAYIAAANPAAILSLITELRQTKAERDWLVVQVVRYKTDCPMNREWEKCNDGQYENRDEPKNNQRCIKCWLQAAKEAISCQKN